MTLSSIIGQSLLFMAIMSLVMGLFMTKYVNMPKKEKRVLLIVSFFAFLWCGGYGVMNQSVDFQVASVGRIIGMVGVYGFISFTIRFFQYFCGKRNRLFNIIWLLLFVFGIVCVVLLSRPGLVVFTRTIYGTTYSSGLSFARYMGFLFFFLASVGGLSILISASKHAAFRRQKKLVRMLMLAECLLFALSIMDSILPTFGMQAFPASCYGVFMCLSLLVYMGTRMNAFTITRGSISRYIFENVETPVLVLNQNMDLLMANTYAEEFFEVKVPEDNKKLPDLFEITKKDAKEYIQNVIAGSKSQSFHLASRNNKAVCDVQMNVVFDEFKEPMCIVAFINDMTPEHMAMERLESMKTSLEGALEEKNKQLENMAMQAINTIANFIDSKEEYTVGHSSRVARYAEAIARELGWSDEEVVNIHCVALLHDIGKIAVPYDVLTKPAGLTDDEFEMIKKHTIIGGKILKDIKTLENVDVGALYHHEHFDGSGYPMGLKGEEIPMVARIICIADAYDAMTTNRRYRKHLSMDIVRAEFEKNAGIQFDPYITSVFLHMMDEGILEKLKTQADSEQNEGLFAESSQLMARVLGGDLDGARADIENDFLTNIWNRRTGERHIQDYLRLGDGALLIVDLANFHQVNQKYGREIGDHILQTVADILKTQGQNQFLCRYTGDEFLMFIRDVTTMEETRGYVDAILYSYNSKREEDEALTYTTLCIGVSLSVMEGRDYHQMFRCADRALYYIKQNGKNGYSFHNRTELNGFGSSTDMTRLVSALKERSKTEGAFQVGFQQFLRAHEYVEQFSKRNQKSIQLVLLDVDFDQSISLELEDQYQVMKELEDSVNSALRGTDVSTRFSSTQMLLILVDTAENNVSNVVRRMLHRFYMSYRPEDIVIQYQSADITGI